MTLKLEADSQSATVVAGTKVGIDRGMILITPPTGPSVMIQIGDRTLGELTELLKGYGLTAQTDWYFEPARYLERTPPKVLSNNTLVCFKAGTGESVSVGLGIVYGLNSESTGGLLGPAGLQLDIIGRTPDMGPTSISARVGIYSDSPVSVQESRTPNETVVQTIESARQVALSASFDWRVGGPCILSLEASSVWSKLDPFVFPDSVSIVFEDLLPEVENKLNKTIPTLSMFLGPAYRSGLFYGGIDVGVVEPIVRTITYDYSDSTSLKATVNDDIEWAYRLRVGFTTIVDVRFDAVAPFGRDKFDPFLRVAISKSF